MRADFLLKVADVFDKMASLVDTQDTEKQAQSRTVRDATVADFATRYRELTGEELPEPVAQKLAASDDDIISTVSQLMEKTTGPVSSLGSSSEKTASTQPVTKRERAAAAWDNFGAFINS